jgi:hypothetical protein
MQEADQATVSLTAVSIGESSKREHLKHHKNFFTAAKSQSKNLWC